MRSGLLDHQDCLRCPQLVASRRQIVHGYGDPSAQIVLIGEAPGRHGADRTGIPFQGDRSGQRIQGLLAALDLTVDRNSAIAPGRHCFITNVVRCCPPENRTPTAAEQANCAPWLGYELDKLNPRIVIPIGRLALRAVGLRYLGYDPGAIRPLHARVLPAADVQIVPMVHPARISHAQMRAFLAVMHPLLAALC